MWLRILILVQPAAFVRAVSDAVRLRLPSDLDGPRIELRHSIAKWWYGNKDLHYECWIRPRLGVIEIGLHFEADPLTNARLLGAFTAREKEVRRGLGKAVQLEEWDRGWARIWEPHDARSLDETLRNELAVRLSRYVAVLEPILREELPAEATWRLPTTRRTA